MIKKITIWKNPSMIGVKKGDKPRVDMDIFNSNGERTRISRVTEEEAINSLKQLFLKGEGDSDE